MKKFILGCNYWASNAGTEMWKNWDEQAVRDDLAILSKNGVEYMRVFPNWRDFQPIIPLMEGQGKVMEYRLEGDIIPDNPYYLDETMMSRFSIFCDICEEYNVKLIVGLLTGWMSGRLFIPAGLFGKNLYTDPVALLFEQRFIKGFVSRFKNKKSIYAWDLGNECNCMSPSDNNFVSESWTGIISNAIRANDNTRQVISGMHSLGADPLSNWSIEGQAEFNDILTTHPYPYWVGYARNDEIGTFRTTMHATCETKLYAGVGRKPCLVEETGTMGPMMCTNELAGDFLRCNMFSNWANGSLGVMWWCANEQTNLKTVPYTWNMCEVELGMIDADRKPKPVLCEMGKFSQFLDGLDFVLPKAKTDAVCILTQSQEQWGIAYMTYCLSKQSGMNIEFTYSNQELPESNVYLLPSIVMHWVMHGENYTKLKKRIYDGAVLYISNDDGILSGFEELTGLRVLDASLKNEKGYFEIDNEKIEFSRNRCYRITQKGAKIISYDNNKIPAVSEFDYGKGKVFYVNFPIEKMLLEEPNAFDKKYYKLYKRIFKNITEKHSVKSDNPYIAVTEHIEENNCYCVAVNHSPNCQKPEFIFNNCNIDKVYYGNIDEIKPFDAVVFKYLRK